MKTRLERRTFPSCGADLRTPAAAKEEALFSVGECVRPESLCLFVRLKALIPLALIFLLSCGTSGKFRSTRDDSYGGKLERALIVYYDENTRSTLGQDFSSRLVSQLADLLGKQNVTCESVLLKRSALDRTGPIKVAAERFQPNQLFFFSVTRASSNSSIQWMDANDIPRYSHSMEVGLEFSVLDLKGDKTIWRTAVDYSSPPNPKEVAQQVVEQLRAARLL